MINWSRFENLVHHQYFGATRKTNWCETQRLVLIFLKKYLAVLTSEKFDYCCVKIRSGSFFFSNRSIIILGCVGMLLHVLLWESRRIFQVSCHFGTYDYLITICQFRKMHGQSWFTQIACVCVADWLQSNWVAKTLNFWQIEKRTAHDQALVEVIRTPEPKDRTAPHCAILVLLDILFWCDKNDAIIYDFYKPNSMFNMEFPKQENNPFKILNKNYYDFIDCISGIPRYPHVVIDSRNFNNNTLTWF